MPKKKPKFVKLQCSQCKRINYYIKKSKKLIASGKKLELKRYCKFCRKHTLHKEVK